jgi:phosphotransferase system HPr (HPr) family protein
MGYYDSQQGIGGAGNAVHGVSPNFMAGIRRLEGARSMVVSRTYLGLGASSMFAAAAAGYRCEIRVLCNGLSADGKQILDVLALRVCPGAEVSIIATGEQSGQAIDILSRILGETH